MQHQPRRRFGQNFLHERGVIDRIVDAVDPRPGQSIVEIGPGLGALTIPLLARSGSMRAIELDRDLFEPLRAATAAVGRLDLIESDVLQVDFRALAAGGMLRVVGNLPYNLSTPILFHLIAQRAAITDMHLMLQREVVERMAADPGSKVYGRLSVMTQFACRVLPLFVIGPGAFRPAPKVESMIVRLIPHAQPPFPTHPERFEAIVRSAFGQRRKTLRNSLEGLVDEARFKRTDIDPGLRAEALSVEEFARLAAD
ncbi:MAG: 16S rRNA (adenine(1518)-N(6)/adenine(1519)-N(6))-dimethyltransferase RsmA [Chromatiales bacterium]|nr:16S rRNA (adenine(1518)-N(6)/adenine(1519)-N(6))-dimethyltransferase RsmA [Chromatiales bacterium]